jgi:hypothetical protein
MNDVCVDRQTDDTQRRVVNSDFRHTERGRGRVVEDVVEDEDDDDPWRHRRTTTTRSREGTDGTPKPNVFVFEPVVAYEPGDDDDDADGAPVRCRDGRGEPTRDERW